MTSDLTFIYGQRGHKTAFDRYPEIFSETKKILEYQVPKRILYQIPIGNVLFKKTRFIS